MSTFRDETEKCPTVSSAGSYGAVIGVCNERGISAYVGPRHRTDASIITPIRHIRQRATKAAMETALHRLKKSAGKGGHRMPLISGLFACFFVCLALAGEQGRAINWAGGGRPGRRSGYR